MSNASRVCVSLSHFPSLFFSVSLFLSVPRFIIFPANSEAEGERPGGMVGHSQSAPEDSAPKRLRALHKKENGPRTDVQLRHVRLKRFHIIFQLHLSGKAPS